MLFSLNELSSDPIGFLTRILLYIPGMLLAISIHESAHGWVAEKCGDPAEVGLRACFVEKIDRLIRQIPVRQIAL